MRRTPPSRCVPLTALATGLLLLAGYVPHGGGTTLDDRVVGSGSIEER